MKRLFLTMLVVLSAAGAAPGQTDTAKWLAEVREQTVGSMAMVICTLTDEVAPPRILSGVGYCIATRKPQQERLGVLLTTALDPRTRPEMLKDFKLVLPGRPGKTLKARLLGIDPETGLSFVEATEPHTWKVMKFVRVEFSVGQQIASVGLMTPKPDYHEPCLGLACVSAQMRMPEPLVYVTGGELSGPGSLVFTAAGGDRAVGLVIQQPYVDHQMLAGRRTTTVGLRSQQSSAFFMPIQEIAHILQPIPSPGKPRQLAWIGVLNFQAVSETLAQSMALAQPGVLLDKVVPGQVGYDAGLRDRDVVVQLNGKDLEPMPTRSMVAAELLRQIKRMPPGTAVELKVISPTGPKTVKLKLAPMPAQPHQAKRYYDRRLGILFREKVMLDAHLSESPAAKVAGLIVLGVGRDSPAGKAGLQRADVITNIDNQSTESIKGYQGIVDAALASGSGKTIIVMAKRGNQDIAISIRPPQPQPKPKTP